MGGGGREERETMEDDNINNRPYFTKYTVQTYKHVIILQEVTKT